MSFKPGDVVQRMAGMREGVVVSPPDRETAPGEGTVWAHWRDVGTTDRPSEPSWHAEEAVSLHPDPDRLLAEWTAWQLTR